MSAQGVHYKPNIQESWAKVLSNLSEEFGENAYKNWFSQMSLQDILENKLVVNVPSLFIKKWISDNYLKYINKKVASSVDGITHIDLKVSKSEPLQAARVNVIQKENECEVLSSRLNKKFRFDNFIVGGSNKLAYQAVKSISDGKNLPGNASVLYIHAKVGMGKTHLLQAATAHIRSNSTKKAAFLSAEKFMHLFIKAVKNNDLISFKEKIKSADILVIDDLQMICGRAGTAQEFCNILNAFVETDKKVIVSSDISPYEMDFDPRTKSRICGGLVAEIKNSPKDLRVKIIKKNIEAQNVKIADDVINLIADSINSSNREVEGAINKIISHQELLGEEISVSDAKELIHDNISAHDKQVTIERIISSVAKFYSVTTSEITSKSRARKFVIPRQICAYLAKQLTTKSLHDIGFKLGKRDHATIVYSVNKLEAQLKSNSELEQEISKITNLIAAL